MLLEDSSVNNPYIHCGKANISLLDPPEKFFYYLFLTILNENMQNLEFFSNINYTISNYWRLPLFVTVNGRRKQQWLFPYRYQISTHLQRRGFSKDLSIVNKKNKWFFFNFFVVVFGFFKKKMLTNVFYLFKKKKTLN